jgi:hypothetical protein
MLQEEWKGEFSSHRKKLIRLKANHLIDFEKLQFVSVPSSCREERALIHLFVMDDTFDQLHLWNQEHRAL